MTRIVVYHGSYGCDTGCCGHSVEMTDDTGKESEFSFSHPWNANTDEQRRAWIAELVEAEFGAGHMADIDWENSYVVDD